MNSIAFTIDEATLAKMKKFYASDSIFCDDAGIIFKAQVIGCVITIKEDLEVVFDGVRANDVAGTWQKKTNKKVKEEVMTGPCHQTHLGSDDIGVADYFGPICTVSCCVEDKDIDFLYELGVQNARTMTNAQIIETARAIKDKIQYSLLILDNPHYNKMVKDGINTAHIRAKLHNQAMTNMMQRLERPVDLKYVEHFVASKTFYNYLKDEVVVVKNLQFEKNSHQNYIAVACAYVLAKYAYLQYFTNMSRSLKVKLPYGTGTTVNEVATTLIKARGKDILNKVAKLHMSNTKKILESI